MDTQISVIVCHHTGKLIDDFIRSIKDSKSADFEIIVVTSDKEYSLKTIKGVRIIYQQFAGPARKRNIGAMFAEGEYLAFFDDDVVVTSRCLRHLVKTLETHRQCGMVYGKLMNMEHRDRFDEAGGFLTKTGFIWSRAGQNIRDVGQFDRDSEIFAGKSASCMIRAELFHKIGRFDEDFGILGEESDLSWRVWLSGHTVMFSYRSKAYHAFNTKFKPVNVFYTSDRVHYNGCRNYLTMLLKNLPTRLLWIVPIHATIWALAGVCFCLSGKWRYGKNVFRGLWYVIDQWGWIMAKRKSVQFRVSEDYNVSDIFLSPGPQYYIQRFLRYVRSGLHG